jgi:hypothetical protein
MVAAGGHGGRWHLGSSLADFQRGGVLPPRRNRYELQLRRFNPDHDYPEVRPAPCMSLSAMGGTSFQSAAFDRHCAQHQSQRLFA